MFLSSLPENAEQSRWPQWPHHGFSLDFIYRCYEVKSCYNQILMSGIIATLQSIKITLFAHWITCKCIAMRLQGDKMNTMIIHVLSHPNLPSRGTAIQDLLAPSGRYAACDIVHTDRDIKD